MNGALFDADIYGEGTAPRQKTEHDPVMPVPWRHPWLLLADKNGVIGHHVKRTLTKAGSIIAECGVRGHRVGGADSMMVPCEECAKKRGL